MPGDDEFRVTLTPNDDGVYAVDARGPGGSRAAGSFRLSLPSGEIERRVLALARGLGDRDVGPAPPSVVDAQRLGTFLADSLLVGRIGKSYETARRRARRRERRLRVTLSLGASPALMPLPWELMYRRTGFVASQRDTPLVRHLEIGEPADPPAIDRAVRMLGIVASPSDLMGLDVAAERELVKRAIGPMSEHGRVELDWLEPATPGALRRALRDSSYHVIHYIGHGGFDASGDAVLLLEDEQDRRSVPLGSAMLTTLLEGQHQLRVVVLNSCHGARSTLADPFASTAATLIERGVPAVVAMQFEISDRAAIRFAFELYTHLFGRHDPIDVAVAEARMALYVEVDQVEWATPVLYLRDPDVDLFHFLLPAIAAPVVAEVVQQWVTSNATEVTPHAAVKSGGRHAIAQSHHIRRVLPYAAGAAVIVGVGAAVWPRDNGPHELAGTWVIDNWRVVEGTAVPSTRNPDVLQPERWTITAESEDCHGDQCELKVQREFDDKPAGSFTLEPVGDGWQGDVGESWNCRQGRRVIVERASEGLAVYTVRQDAGSNTLEVIYAYQGTPTDAGLQDCPSEPVEAVEFTGDAVIEEE